MPLKDLRSWDDGDKLVDEFGFIVLNRPNYAIDTALMPKKHIILD